MCKPRRALPAMLNSSCRQAGVTLIELMIAGVIGVIVLAALVTVYSTTATHSSRHLQDSHLHQQMHGMLHYMTDDIRRAGYWHFDPDTETPTGNLFQAENNRIRTDAWPGETTGSCILYSYDLDQDGLIGVGRCAGRECAPGTDSDNVEQFGFRLRNRQLQSRYGGHSFQCDTGYWQSLSDPDIEILAIEFIINTHCVNLNAPNSACQANRSSLNIRLVEIYLQAQLQDQPDTRLTLRQPVHVRNDYLVE